jgi:hypothetical protein
VSIQHVRGLLRSVEDCIGPRPRHTEIEPVPAGDENEVDETVRSRGISRQGQATARRPRAFEERKEIVPRSPRLRAESISAWSDIMQKLSAKLLAIAVLIELICLVGAERHADPLTVSIESTELWYNPWPAPGDQTLVANGQCRIPQGVCVPADGSL